MNTDIRTLEPGALMRLVRDPLRTLILRCTTYDGQILADWTDPPPGCDKSATLGAGDVEAVKG